jgi:hypothetical protein
VDGATTKAQEHLTAAAKSSRKARDRRGQAAASYALGDLLMGSLRPKDAEEPYENAMQLIVRGGFSADELERLPGHGPMFTVQSGDQPCYLGPWTRFSDITQPGWSKLLAAAIVPQLNGANPAPVYGEALHAFRASGDRFGEGYALLALGHYARLRSTRIRRLTKAADVFQELAHPLGVGLVQLAMGDNCSDPGKMLAAYQQSAAIFHTLGDQAMEGLGLLKAATLHAVLGRWDDATKDWARSERLIADSRAEIDVRVPRMFLVELTLRAGHEAGYLGKIGSRRTGSRAGGAAEREFFITLPDGSEIPVPLVDGLEKLINEQ